MTIREIHASIGELRDSVLEMDGDDHDALASLEVEQCSAFLELARTAAWKADVLQSRAIAQSQRKGLI